MRPSSFALVVVAFGALVGCQIGCDGERAHKTATPHTPAALGDGGVGGLPASANVGEPQWLGHERDALDVAPGSLDYFFTALAAAEKNDPTGRVDIVFFGDSHTAGDAMTSRMRSVWQHRFGDAGRGVVAAGKPPVKHYYQRDVKYGRTGVWTGAVGGKRGDSEPFGIAGLRVSGTRKGAQLWVETCADCLAGKTTAQFEILYYAAPDHGVVRYKVDDGKWSDLPTKTTTIEPPHPGRQVVPVQDGPHKLTLEHGGGGPIDLFGVVMETMKPGVIVDALGVVGRRLGSLRSWDWSIIGEQLSTRDPRLVILQYGTNEADDPELVLEDMARYYDETILRIRAAAPTAAILILGPPDMGVREGGKACDKMKPPKEGVDAGVMPECEWHTPGILREIISVEHAAAVRNKVAFFDTFAAMGGGDLMNTWATSDPKIAFKDRIHLTTLGYARWADMLGGAVFDEYQRWRKQNSLPPSSPLGPPPIVVPAPASPPPPEDTQLPGPVAP
jgi:lysophospholipase L1-like esterase